MFGIISDILECIVRLTGSIKEMMRQAGVHLIIDTPCAGYSLHHITAID